MTATPLWTPPGACVRQAWLVLGSLTVPLENQPGGWFCSSLDLGYPAVREVIASRPSADGGIDRTQYFGPRVVTANITALRSAGAQIDAAAYQFAPMMVPSARPVLHYVLDRPGQAERTMILRPSGYAWPIVGADQRDIQLQFVAADPYVYAPTVNTVTTAGTLFPGSAMITNGDIPAQPVFQITGPVTGANLRITGAGFEADFPFLSAYVIAAGHYIAIDAHNKTVYLDGNPNSPALAQVNWPNAVWPVLPVGVTRNLGLAGTATTAATQVTATWQDGYYL